MATKAEIRNLRACLRCQFVQMGRDYHARGCPNCEEILDMQGSWDSVGELTTTNYDGLLAMTNPEKSWVAKWQHIEKRVPGLYAIKVNGRLPDDRAR